MKSIFVAIAFFMSVAPYAVAAATVSGKIVDDRNRPLAGATVWVHIRPGASERPRPYSAWTRSGPDGGFRIAGVPAGDFVACAQLPGSPYVDGCFWEAPRKFVLTGSARLDVGTLRLRQGHQLRVRIDDPSGELQAARKARRATDLRLGVWTGNGSFYPLRLLYREPNREEYGAIVPYDAPLRLMVQARRSLLADERGAPIDHSRGLQVPLTIRPGKEPPALRLQVAGAQP
jgi:hypothetical protein